MAIISMTLNFLGDDDDDDDDDNDDVYDDSDVKTTFFCEQQGYTATHVVCGRAGIVQ